MASSTAETRARPVFVLTGTSGEGKSTLAKLLVQRVPELERIAGRGRSPVLEIETGGALAVRDRVPAAVTIFVTAPSREERERRLRSRATESEGEIDERLDIAERQLALAPEFDHTLVNDDRERAVKELEGIVRSALDGAGTMAAHDPSPR